MFDFTLSIHYKFHFDIFPERNIIASEGFVKSTSFSLSYSNSK